MLEHLLREVPDFFCIRCGSKIGSSDFHLYSGRTYKVLFCSSCKNTQVKAIKYIAFHDPKTKVIKILNGK
jgi:hypothetical protein